MKFIRISAEEYVYGEDSKTLNTEQYKQKMRMSTSVIDLIRNATIKYDAPDFKNHKMFRAGFKNYQGRVGIDETIFNYIVRVGKAQDGKIFYNICLEVDGKVPRAKRTSLIKSSTSKGSISKKSANSNTSDKKSENSSGREFALDIDGEAGRISGAEVMGWLKDYSLFMKKTKQTQNLRAPISFLAIRTRDRTSVLRL